MYLEVLTDEERRLFLDLAWMAIECDGEVADEEREVIASYQVECQVADYERSCKTQKEILNLLANSERSHKKIILLELMGIWGADGKWRDPEIAMMDQIAAALGIPDSRVNRLRRWSREFRQILVDGYQLVMEA